MEIDIFLEEKAQLLINNYELKLSMEPAFWKDLPEKAGVYILKNIDTGEIVYVGETRTLRHRLKDLLHTNNHSFRRAVFKNYLIHSEKKYKESKRNISEHICKYFTYSYLEVSLGRKEIEEFIIKKEKGSASLMNTILIKKLKINSL